MDASPEYFTQQNFQSLQKDKSIYSTRKLDLTNTQPQTQLYTKYQKENFNPRKFATPKKAQTIYGLLVANPKEGESAQLTSPKMTTKLIAESNRYSLISLNISGLNSQAQAKRLDMETESTLLLHTRNTPQPQRQTSPQSKGL